MKRFLLSFIALTVGMFFAKGQTNCSISQTAANAIAGSITWTSMDQTFVACSSGLLNSITLYHASGTQYVGYSINVSGPNGTSASLGLAGQNTTVTVSFAGNPYYLSEGETYRINISRASGNNLGFSFRYSNDNNSYPQGSMRFNGAAATGDMYFVVSQQEMATPAFLPAHQSSDVSRSAPLKLKYGYVMKAGTGNINIKKIADGSTTTIAASDAIFGADSTIALNLPTPLEANESYAVHYALGTFLTSNNLKASAVADGDWTYTTSARPYVLLSESVDDTTSVNPVTVNIDFSTAVTGFSINDITSNGSLSNFTGSGTSYTVDVTPAQDGRVYVSIPENVAQDATPQGNTASEELSFVYDGTFNTPAVTASVDANTSVSPFYVTYSFDEPYRNLSNGDFQLNNAEILKITESDSSFVVKVGALAEGAVEISLTAGSVTDRYGNTNTSAAFSTNYSMDLDNGRTAFYPFNNSYVDFTRRQSTMIKTNVASSTYPTSIADHHGNADGSLEFDNSDILATNGYTSSSANGGFSASVWVKPINEVSSTNNYRRVVYSQWATYSTTTSALVFHGGQIKIELNNKAHVYTKDTTLYSDTWYHLAFSAENGGDVILYINNKSFNLGTAPTNITGNSYTLFIGGEINQIVGATENSGSTAVDDLMFFKKALNPLEVNALHNDEPRAYKVENEGICTGETFDTGNEIFETTGNYAYLKDGGNAMDTLIALNLTVHTLPTIIASPSASTVCEGNEVKISGSGGVSYELLGNYEIDTYFTPAATADYTVVGTDANGCQNTNTITIEVIPTSINDEALTADQTYFCQAGGTATISTASSVTGVNYYLKNSQTNAVLSGPVSGTGNSLSFTTPALNESISLKVFAEEENTSPTGGLDFDGVNDKVQITHTASMELSTNFTIEGWINSRATTYTRIFTNYSGAGNTPGDIVIDLVENGATTQNGKGFRVYLVNSSNTATIISTGNVFEQNTWNHYAVRFDNGAVELIVNGSVVKTGTFSQTSIPANNNNWILGEDRGGTTGEYFNGVMDDFRVWNYTRSLDDIRANMNNVITGQETGLVLYYKFDDGANATSVTDSSPNGNNGTLVNMTPASDWVDGIIHSENACNRTMSQTLEITVGDQVAPEVEVSPVTVTLSSNGDYTLSPESLSIVANDDCNTAESLIYSLSKTQFNCSDLGQNSVELYAQDASGNKDTVAFTVTVLNYIEDRSLIANATNSCNGSDISFTIENSQVGIDYFLINGETQAELSGPIAGTGSDLSVTPDLITESSSFGLKAAYPNRNIGLDFDGVNDKVNINYHASMALSSAFTIETWIKPRATTYTRVFTNFSGASNAPGDIIMDLVGSTTQNGRGLRIYLVKSNSSGVSLAVDNVVTINEWNHIAATFENGSMKLYVNGALVGSSAFGETSLPANVKSWTIGEDRAGSVAEYFNGTMDEFRIWNVAKTQTEIQASKDNCLSGQENGLVIYYNFNTGKGSGIVEDMSNNDNNGTLINMDPATDWITGYVDCTQGAACAKAMSDVVKITLGDDINPTVEAQNIDLPLDANGNALLTIEMIELESSDNCTAESDLVKSLSKSSFTCEDIGAHTVYLRVSDETGNIDSAAAIINIVDNSAPVITLFDLPGKYKGALSQEGTLSITAEQFDNGTTDNCSAVTVSIDKTDFTTADLGPNTITLSASDENGNSTSQTFTFEVGPSNQAPVVESALTEFTMSEDQGMSILLENISAAFSDPENDELTYNVSSSTANIMVMQNELGQVTVNSEADFFGSGVITISASDEFSTTTMTVNVIVNAVNDAPAFNIQSELTLAEDFDAVLLDAAVSTQPANEADQTITYSISPSSSELAIVSIDPATGVISVSPITDAFGSQEFTITANDGEASNNTASATFTLTINGVDDEPVISYNASYTYAEDFAGIEGIFPTVAHPANEGQTLAFSVSPASLSFAQMQFEAATGKIHLIAIENAFGSADITVTVTDGVDHGKIISQTFNITITSVNDAPAFELNRSEIVVSQDFNSTELITLKSLQPANETETVTYSISPASVSFANVDFNSQTGQTSITAVAGASGDQVFTITANDGQSENNTSDQTFSLSVLANQAPEVANPISDVTVSEDPGSVVITTSLSSVFSDPDGDQISISATSDNEMVSVVVGDNSLVASVAANYFGSAVITVTANDGSLSTSDVFTIQITSVNDAPVVVQQPSMNLQEDQVTATLDVSTIFQDVDNDLLTYSLDNNNSSVFAATLSGSMLSVTPHPNMFGTHTLIIGANDGTVITNYQLIVDIANVNDLPTVFNQPSFSFDEDGAAQSVQFSTVFADADNDALTFAIEASKSEEAPIVEAVISGNSLVVTPVANAFGTTSVVLTASDAEGSTSVTINISIASINDTPEFTLSADEFILDKNFTQTESINITAGFVPANESAQTVTYTVSPNDGSLVNITIDGTSIHFTAVSGAVGTQTFTVTATDGSEVNGSYSQTFTVTVREILGWENAAIKVYPNPATSFIVLETVQNGQFSLYNMNGSVVRTGSFNETIDVQDLQSGMYMIRFTDQDGKEQTQKLIIKH